jgi:uncharacterized peroxidase-related enzyme
MSRINAIDPKTTEGKTKELLAGVEKMLGATPNLFRVTANAPASLEALVSLFGATAKSSLSAKVREQIALAVAETNGCDYCVSAHCYLGSKAGLTNDDMLAARDASSHDPKTAAILRFARNLVLQRGRVGAAGLDGLLAVGVSKQEALDVVAVVILNIFTNYINLVADTDIDFPVVRTAQR